MKIQHPISFGTRNSEYDNVATEERMVFGNGNVGIGVPSPQKLHLGSGNIRIDYTSTSYLIMDHNHL